MKINKIITTTALSLPTYLLNPAITRAALGSGQLTENTDASFLDFLSRIQGWIIGLVGGLAVLFLVYGGFQYMTSSGNPKQVETAKKTITYAIIGLVIVVLSGLIFQLLTGNFITSIFGTKTL